MDNGYPGIDFLCRLISNSIDENDEKDIFLLICINTYLHIKRDKKKANKKINGGQRTADGLIEIFTYS